MAWKGLLRRSKNDRVRHLDGICAKIADERSLEFGQFIFDEMPKKFDNNTVVITSALQMFIKCGDISKAEQLFNRIEKKNLFTYSIMMNGKKIYSFLIYHSLICLFPLRFCFKQTRTTSY